MGKLDVFAVADGVEATLRALNGLADERGKKWKRSAMLIAGKEAFAPVVRSASANAPRATGLTAGAMASTPGKYNSNAAKQVTARGKIRKGGRNEYVIGTTIRPSYERRLPLNSKGQRVRYPFILEAGVRQTTYTRQKHVRNGVIVRAHSYKRRASRNPLLFQHRALRSNAVKVVQVWSKKMDYFIYLYEKTTYSSLSSAVKAHERSIMTGRKSRKWR